MTDLLKYYYILKLKHNTYLSDFYSDVAAKLFNYTKTVIALLKQIIL